MDENLVVLSVWYRRQATWPGRCRLDDSAEGEETSKGIAKQVLPYWLVGWRVLLTSPSCGLWCSSLINKERCGFVQIVVSLRILFGEHVMLARIENPIKHLFIQQITGEDEASLWAILSSTSRIQRNGCIQWYGRRKSFIWFVLRGRVCACFPFKFFDHPRAEQLSVAFFLFYL